MFLRRLKFSMKKNLFKSSFTELNQSEVPKGRPSANKHIEFNPSLTNEQKINMKRFDIYRYNPENTDAGSYLMTYYLDLKECGPMLLDALIKIKDELDPTLTFRRSILLI